MTKKPKPRKVLNRHNKLHLLFFCKMRKQGIITEQEFIKALYKTIPAHGNTRRKS